MQGAVELRAAVTVELRGAAAGAAVGMEEAAEAASGRVTPMESGGAAQRRDHMSGEHDIVACAELTREGQVERGQQAVPRALQLV